MYDQGLPYPVGWMDQVKRAVQEVMDAKLSEFQNTLVHQLRSELQGFMEQRGSSSVEEELSNPEITLERCDTHEWTCRFVRGFRESDAWGMGPRFSVLHDPSGEIGSSSLSPRDAEESDDSEDGRPVRRGMKSVTHAIINVNRMKNQAQVHPGTLAPVTVSMNSSEVPVANRSRTPSPRPSAKQVQRSDSNDSISNIYNLLPAVAQTALNRIDPHGFLSKQGTARIVKSSKFEATIGFFVVLNAVMVGIETHMRAQQSRQSFFVFEALDYVFFCIFLIEITMRIYVFRRRFFRGHGCYFNVLDLSLVVLQFIEILLDNTMQSKGLRALSGLRVLKLIRLVRMARILRQIRDLRTLIFSILVSLRSLFWTLILLLLLIYVFSFIITQLVTDAILTKPLDPAKTKVLTDFYGGMDRSMFSLFEALFGGQDWDVLVRPLMENVGGGMSLLFVFYIAFSTLAMMNVVTGVFVENVLECAKKDRETFLINNVRELFSLVDGGLQGFMNWETFESKLETAEMRAAFKAINVDLSEARNLFNLLDLDNSKQVNASEFLAGCLRLRGPAMALDLAVLIREVKQLRETLHRHRVPAAGA